ncbi:glycosyltransferase [Streptomonospora nanhaiensis]|uniref:glycosyltransferase n=1 Tax=Streptomonospora nanhaiensis TaxID=1323731 RepID=UPI001C38E99E|nr:glycosyltransferase [Streptomonospora nanhaiensis]MBV2365339.1 glycosyltransferase [Streptomonospora nanhaiensis]
MAADEALPPPSWERTPRVLMVAYVSGRHPIGGGVSVFNEHLTNALARDFDVTLLMSAPPHEHPGVRVVTVDPERIAMADFPRLALHLTPDDVGLPRDPGAFDLIVSHNEFLGEAAIRVREEWYPQARYAHGVHTAAEKYRRLIGEEALGRQEADRHRWIMNRMDDRDVVWGVGRPLTDEGLRMARTVVPGPRHLRSHELIPGFQTLPGTAPPSGDRPFTIYTIGRLDDPIKGMDQLFEAVRRLRAQGVNVVVRCRGVRGTDTLSQEENLRIEQRRVDRIMGEAGAVTLLPFTSDVAELDAEMRQADLCVMPSLHEGYGLVAVEPLERGVAGLVNQDSGIAHLLLHHPDVPRELGRNAVVMDDGLDANARVAAWAEAILAAVRERAERWAGAERLRLVGQRFVWTHSASALVHAGLLPVDRDPGLPRHTRQGADGRLLIATERVEAEHARAQARLDVPLRRGASRGGGGGGGGRPGGGAPPRGAGPPPPGADAARRARRGVLTRARPGL